MAAIKLAILPVLAIAAGLAAQAGMKTGPSGAYLASAMEKHPLTSISNFFEIIVPFFKALATSNVGQGLIVMAVLIAGPTISFLFIEAGKRGRSFTMSPLVPLLTITAGQVIGIGVALPIAAVTAFCLGQLLVGADKPPLPSPAPTYIYAVEAANFFAVGSTLAVTFIGVNHQYWDAADYAFQFFPLAYVPATLLALFSPSRADPKTAMAAADFFRRQAFLTIPIHFLAVGLIARGFILSRTSFKWDFASYFMLFDNAGVLAALILLFSATRGGSITAFLAKALQGGFGYAGAEHFAEREKAAASAVVRADVKGKAKKTT